MKFSELPHVAQEALKAKFVHETREMFDDMRDELLDTFLELPEVKVLWEAHRDFVWNQMLADNDSSWCEWLEAHDVEAA